jgi:CubicO group peptidase (beta-lactamase class C family)
VLYQEAHGTLATHPWVAVRGEPVRRETRYDLASLTKVLGTTTLVAIAVSEGWLSLESPVPEPYRRACPGATLADLLEHSAGLTAHREYFLEVDPPAPAEILARVAATPPESPLRARSLYSDLGFLILGDLLERAAGRGLLELFEDRVAYPLGLHHKADPELGFLPLRPGGISTALQIRIAPTEVYDPGLHPEGPPSYFRVRGGERYAHGEVHDDNAWAMGGVAGHAGLFGSASGVLEVALAWLEARIPGLSPAVRQRFWTASRVPGSTRWLGFDGPAHDGSGSCGLSLGSSAVGHTGFTGTSLWMGTPPDGEPRVCVLLANRVHPTRTREGMLEFRQRFHQAAVRL